MYKSKQSNEKIREYNQSLVIKAIQQNHDGELQNKLKQSLGRKPTLQDRELISGWAIQRIFRGPQVILIHNPER